MRDYVFIFWIGMMWAVVGFYIGVINFNAGPAPITPDFHEKISAKISYVNRVKDVNGNEYYLFFDDGKEVKIKIK